MSADELDVWVNELIDFPTGEEDDVK